MHSDGRVFKNPSKSFHILSFWVLLLLSLWAFWAHPLYWEVNKDQRLQVKSENRTDICGTDKYQQFYHVFLRILTKKIVIVKGKQAKVGFLASTWADFDVFWSNCNFEAFESKNSRKSFDHEKFPSIWREFDVKSSESFDGEKFSSIWREFDVKCSESFDHEKFSSIWREFDVKCSESFDHEKFSSIWREMFRKLWSRKISVNLTIFFFRILNPDRQICEFFGPFRRETASFIIL